MTEHFTVCPFAGCHQDCVLKVAVQDGRAVKVESVEMPGEPGERRACLRGLASLRWLYHPDRLKYPLKRTGERGEGKWERVSWDEALDGIASKLLEIRERYGSRAVKVMPGGSSSVGTVMGRLAGLRFASAWGAGGAFEGRGYTSDGGIPAALLLVLGDSYQSHDCRDYLNSKMVILWGGNPAETCIPEMRYYLDARENGARIVNVSPVYHASAAKADWWIPVKTATDAALALGMLNVIVQRGLYDRSYLLRHTVGPFLVRSDTGRFLREKDISAGGSDRPLVWEVESPLIPLFQRGRAGADVIPPVEKGRARPHDEPGVGPALSGSFNVQGIECRTAFDLLKERAAEYPLDKASEICGLPAATIERLAVEYATNKPAAIRLFHGMARTLNSNLALRAIITLGAVTGNIGVSGGGVSQPDWSGYPIELNSRGVSSPKGAPGVSTLPGTKNSLRGWRAIADGKPYPVKALLIAYQNPFQNYGNVSRYREILSRMDLVVVSDVFMTMTARFADYVLPEASTFERADIAISKNHLVRMEKAVGPAGEARTPLDIWGGLATRVGLGRFFESTEAELFRVFLDSGHPSVAGITLDRLEREKVVRANVPLAAYVPFADKDFPTATGKIEFYVESQLEFGEELPFYREPLESAPPGSGSGSLLRLLTIKTKNLVQSQLANVDWMQGPDPAPYLVISPADAGARGIGSGEMVRVFNDRGDLRIKARVSSTVPAGTVNVYHGPWPEHFVKGHYNQLLHAIDDPNAINPALETDQIVKDTKAAAHMVHYDVLVRVERG
ncbi:MAG: molybdopterin-dependent oxidoreductase [Chloroflexi bacterium]|nr:molybdopterin-dependent oxidoreductase [Chloroflexota bacterium]